ncbi:MAG: hypothetical protein P8Y70_16605 [Candidatus Lokiarchaeota archaeon]
MIFPLEILNEFFEDDPSIKGILSIWGDYGVGKSTLVLQTLMNYLNKNQMGILFYTKKSFPFSLFMNIFSKSYKNINKINEKLTIFNVLEFSDLFETIFKMEILILKLLQQKTNLHFIVIDSLTNLYNLDLTKKGKKYYFFNFRLNMMMAHLSYLKKKYKLTILVVNELTYKKIDSEVQEVQSGGNVMDFWTPNRIKIERSNILNTRKFILENK